MAGDPLTAAELQDISNRLRVRRNVGLVFTGVFVVVLVLFFILATSVLSSNSRQDCKTRYNAILNGPVMARDNLSASLQAQLGTALLNATAGIRPTPDVVITYTQTRDQLNVAIAVIKAEPTLNKASTKGFTWHHVHYNACPSA